MSHDKPKEKTVLEHGNLPAPEAKAMAYLFDQFRELERMFGRLAAEQGELKPRLDPGIRWLSGKKPSERDGKCGRHRRPRQGLRAGA